MHDLATDGFRRPAIFATESAFLAVLFTFILISAVEKVGKVSLGQ